MSINLRPYQHEALQAIFAYWQKGGGNPLVEMATGTGKSMVIAKLVRDILESYPQMRVVMLTHVKELVEQNFMALKRVWPEAPAGIYAAGLNKRDVHHKIIFASIQSVYNKARALAPRHLILIDEAHLCPLKGEGMYRQFLSGCDKYQGDVRVVGFTATPYRLDSGRLDGGEARRNGTDSLPQGIDVRGARGYVIAPTVQFEGGREYEYQGKLEDLLNAPVLPDWLADVLDEGKVESPSPVRAAPLTTPVKLNHDEGQIQNYVQAAIDGELAKLRGALKGGRNNTLNEVAFALGRLVGAGVLNEGEIIALIHEAAASTGLGRNEIIATTHSGLQSGKKEPRQLQDYLFDEWEKPVSPGEEEHRRQIAEVIRQSFLIKESVRQVIELEDGGLADAVTGEIIEDEPKPADKNAPAHEIDYPAGLVGEIARWIVATARYPQPELAIGAALAIVATAAGRHFASPTKSATQLYIWGCTRLAAMLIYYGTYNSL